ncbi:MAG: bacillithiol biosynthesis deacetylase BshB1 [Chitinophagaceae bacterium]|nr:bacillithiol biosynthesis deacetylase BshB1 [Chitinophagaceae bacterium]
MKIDILAIGVHPDDVELGCSGTLIREIQSGKTAAIADLTEGELGTRGTVEIRYQESAKAASVMGITQRENLKMKDGFFEHNEENLRRIISVIRHYRPDIILANALEDRHPDHGRAGKLISDAAFLSGLSKIETFRNGMKQERWRPAYVLHYIQDWYHEPDFLIDISEVFERKMEAIRAFASQFYSGKENDPEPQTYISRPDFLESVEARARMLGKKIGVKYAEGFISVKKIGLKSLDALIKIET